MASMVDFVGIRSQYYKEIMKQFPFARDEEKKLALGHLNPKKGEKILEIGGGSGFFSLEFARCAAPAPYIVSDPSEEQLNELQENAIDNLYTLVASGDELIIDSDGLNPSSFDAIFSGGAFHHVPNKTQAFETFSRLLKPGGRLVISDVFAGSNLARHFDLEVAKYCVTGHEVSFLSEEFAHSLCYLYNFEEPSFTSVTIQWKFDSRQDLGNFLYKIHAMIHTTPEHCYTRAEEILGIEVKNNLYCLNWPLTVFKTRRKP